jgi:hypothetical protein
MVFHTIVSPFLGPPRLAILREPFCFASAKFGADQQTTKNNIIGHKRKSDMCKIDLG